MIMKRVLFALLCFAGAVLGTAPGAETPATRPDQVALKRWQDMRFGMFIHWGPVSIKGTEIGWSRGRQVPKEEYDGLYKQFNPVKFNAAEWVSTAKAAGMKYLVITSKHHDGFCIWDSAFTDYDIMATPFGRDILKELSEECRKQGILFCTYHSICDWWHPDYPTDSAGGRGKKATHNMPRYVEYLASQTREIVEKYGPIGIMWFDGEWEKPWTKAYGSALYHGLKKLQPDIIVNNRVGKGRHGMAGTTKGDAGARGDYDTPEQRIGGFNRERPWETCMTICRQWAWKPNDNMKSLQQCLRTLILTAGGDGNLLFNVGPMPDGRIEPRQVERLKEMGRWLERHGESIYVTRGGPYMPTKAFACTHRGSRVYLHLLGGQKRLSLPPVGAEITKSSVLGAGRATVSATPEGVEITVAQPDPQGIDTIVVLELDRDASRIEPLKVAGMKAKASNVYRKMSNYAADCAVDGDPATRWATDAGLKQCWVEVDLLKPRTVSSVMIDEWAARIQKYELQYRENGEWITCRAGTTLGKSAHVRLKPVTARHFRLNILDATDGPTINEIVFE